MTARFHRRWIPLLLWFLAGLLALTLVGRATPATAQINETDQVDKAPVVLDGEPIFALGNTDRYTAAERAKWASQTLQQSIQPIGLPSIIQITDNDQETIQVNGKHLLTVTEADLERNPEMLGFEKLRKSSKAQAQLWVGDLKTAFSRAQQERTLEYQRQAALLSAGIIAIAIALHLGVQWLRQRLPGLLFRWLCKSDNNVYHHWEQPLKLFTQLALAGLQIGLWAAVVWNVADFFPLTRSWRHNVIYFLSTSINSPIFTLGEKGYSALNFLVLIALTVGLWFAVRALTGLLKAYLLRTTGTDRGIQETIAILTQYALTFLGLIVILQVWGIDVSSLAIIASVLGVGIGLGLQNIANDFVSGLIINLERPIQVGDFVNVGNLVGTVERIGARSTEIRTLDRVSILIPNSRFMDSEVINWSHGDPVSRLRIPVGVAYGSDVTRVRSALLKAGRKHPDVLNNPAPQVWFQEFGDSSLNFELLVWISEPRSQFLLKSDLNYRIEVSLREHGIEVPFPQRDIHLRTPQLDELIATWLRSQSTSNDEPKLYYPNRTASVVNVESDAPEIAPPEPTFEAEPVQFIEDIDLNQWLAEMRSSEGVSIKDRRHRITTYPKCFVGSEAVAWLVRNKHMTRENAVRIGQLLIDRNLAHHVLDEHPFIDGFYFYRFYADE